MLNFDTIESLDGMYNIVFGSTLTVFSFSAYSYASSVAASADSIHDSLSVIAPAIGILGGIAIIIREILTIYLKIKAANNEERRQKERRRAKAASIKNSDKIPTEDSANE